LAIFLSSLGVESKSDARSYDANDEVQSASFSSALPRRINPLYCAFSDDDNGRSLLVLLVVRGKAWYRRMGAVATPYDPRDDDDDADDDGDDEFNLTLPKIETELD
jgi:hypothetical protein